MSHQTSETSPWSFINKGKNGRLIYHSNHNGQRIIFDTGDCKDKFDKAPASFKVTPKK